MKNLVMLRVLIFFLCSTPFLIFGQEKPFLIIDPQGHSSSYQTLFFNKDGSRIITFSADKSICIWDVQSGAVIKTIRGHIGDGLIGSLDYGDFTAEKNLLAVTGYLFNETPGTVDIRIIDTEKGEQIGRVKSSLYGSIHFSKDSKYLLLNNADKKLQVYKVSDGEPRSIRYLYESVLPDNYWTFKSYNDGMNFISLGTDSMITIWQSSSPLSREQPFNFNKIKTLDPEYKFTRFALSKNDKYIIATTSKNELLLFDGKGNFLKVIDYLPDMVSSIAISADEQIVAINGFLGMPGKTYRLPSGAKIMNAFTNNNTVTSSGIFPQKVNGRYWVASVGGNSGELQIWDAESGSIIKTLKGVGKKIYSVGVNNDMQIAFGNLLFAPDGLTRFDKVNPIFGAIPEYTPYEKVFDFKELKMQPLQNPGSFKRAATIFKNEKTYKTDNYTLIVGNDTITSDKNVNGRMIIHGFKSNGDVVLGGDYTMIQKNRRNEEQLRFYSYINNLSAMAISEDEQYLFSGGVDQIINVYNLGKEDWYPSVLEIFTHPSWLTTFQNYGLTEAAKVKGQTGWENIITELVNRGDTANANIIKGYDHAQDVFHNKWPLASLFVAGDDWICWTPNGYFASSKGAEKYIGWHINNTFDSVAKFYPAEQLWDLYYAPDVVRQSIMNREPDYLVAKRLGYTDTNITAKLSTVPLIKIVTPEENFTTKEDELEINIEAVPIGVALKEIRIFHNGKLIATENEQSKLNLDKKINKTYKLKLLPGKNEIQATVVNQKNIESFSKKLEITFDKPLFADNTSNLFIVGIGINKYQNELYNLSYCVADLDSFNSAVNLNGKDIFKSITSISLINEQANKRNILSALDSISKKARPQDVFVFFFSGHGVMSMGDDTSPSEFYYSTTEVTKLYGDDAHLKQKAISANEIKDYCSRIPALKQLIIMDACQSGGALNTFAAKGAAEEKAKMQLARSTGITVLASSGSEQRSNEALALGHGLFTYVLLKGLFGDADGIKDKKITVKELDAFLNESIPEFSYRLLGLKQYPVCYSFGQDFPLVVIK